MGQFNANLKILITGTSGFLGSHIWNELKPNKKFNILKIHSDLRIQKDVLNFPKAKIVIHVAGRIPQIPDTNPTSLIENNVIGTYNLLKYCEKKKIEKIIYISSYVYGLPKYCPIDENHPVNPHNPYAESKYIAEQLCKYYSKNFGIKLVILRPFNIFGKSQRPGMLIPNLLKAIKTNKKITITNTESKLDYLHINDLVNLIPKILNYDCKFEIFNVGSGRAYSSMQIMEKIEEITKKKFNVEFNESKNNFIKEIRADITKISNELDWKPKIGLKEGLRLSL